MPFNRNRRTRVLIESARRERAEREPIIAVKIGGSLLSSPQLIDRIEWLLAQRPQSRPIMMVGGGATADQVRRWQQMHDISDAAAHRLALSAMTFNERLLASALPDSRLIRDAFEMEQAWTEEQRPILQTTGFIRDMDAILEESFEESWEVTSDSIAAWCAQLAGASELILAKSTDLPIGTTLDAAIEEGLIDEQFGQSRCPETVTWVNLREAEPTLTEWEAVQGG